MYSEAPPPPEENPDLREAYTPPADASSGYDSEDISIGCEGDADDNPPDLREPTTNGWIEAAISYGDYERGGDEDRPVMDPAMEQEGQREPGIEPGADRSVDGDIPEGETGGFIELEGEVPELPAGSGDVPPREPPTHDTAAGALEEGPEGPMEKGEGSVDQETVNLVAEEMKRVLREANQVRHAAGPLPKSPLLSMMRLIEAITNNELDKLNRKGVAQGPDMVPAQTESADGQAADGSSEPLATSDQARELFREVKELTASRPIHEAGKSLYDYDLEISAGDIAAVPSEVAKHLPAVEDSAGRVRHSVTVWQRFDSLTGEPLKSGNVGVASFEQRQPLDDQGNFFVDRVNYFVTLQDESTYGLERKVSSTEEGPRQQARDRDGDQQVLKLGEYLSLARNIPSAPAEARARGLFDVTEVEAQQVIDVVKALNERG